MAFLAAVPPPVFAGFGSMTPDHAGRLSEVIAAAGRQAGVRMVIQAGQAGLSRADGGDSIAIGEVPHDWLFPQVAVIVHHASAGTTATGLRAGIPAVAAPMLGDQPFWAARIAALGAGPRPVPLKRLSAPALAAAIRAAVSQSSYREQARAVAARLAREDGTAPVVTALARLAG